MKTKVELSKLDIIQFLCEKRLKQLNLQDDNKYILRLEKELANIDVQNLQDYILNAVENKVKIESHSSLMYFLLNISSVDPIVTSKELKAKKQSSFPDIDSDFSIEEREKVVKYFIEKYGSDHVASIGAYGQMRMKMVLRDVARIFDIDLNDTNEIAKALQEDIDTMSEDDFDILMEKEPNDEGFRQDVYDLKQYFVRHPEIKEIIFILKGQLRHLTKHPAGVVATPGLIDESIPLMRHKDGLITSWVDGITRKDLQSSGFIKFDILGLKTLTIIKEILELIRNRKSYNPVADFDLNSIEKGQLTSLLYEEFSSLLPLDGNQIIYEKFRKTDTNGIFQFECLDGDTWIGNYRIKELYRRYVSQTDKIPKISCVDLKNRTKARQSIFIMKKQEKKPVWLLVLDDGRCILATQLHEFFTSHSWKRFEDLTIDDKILIDLEKCRSQYWCESKQMIVDEPRIDSSCRKCVKNSPPCKPHILNKFKKEYKRRYKYFRISKMIKGTAALKLFGEREVYDIGFMPGLRNKIHHNYVANGMVVHNSNLMKSLLKEIKPTSFSDITSATALGRPGPLDMGMHHEYAARKNGKKFDFGNVHVERCLKDSFGILVYQEDVMRLCHIVAGFPLDLTDTVRKNLMKSIRDTDAKDKEAKQRKEIKDKFIKGCVTNGLTEKTADAWWTNCVSFARYGFNKSHAVAYTILSYQMMWFKEYYPLEFYTVLFSNSDAEKFGSYFSEAMNKSINIVPVDITRARESFTIHNNENSIMFGLSHIMGLGPAVVKIILESGPYHSFEDFWEKTAAVKKIGKSAMLALINAHAFDCFGEQNNILERYYLDFRKEKGWARDVDYNDRQFEHDKFIEAYSLDWRTKLSEDQKQVLKSLNAKTLAKLVNPTLNLKRYVWGIVNEIVRKTSKAGNSYFYVILTDSKFNTVKLRIPTYNRRCKKAFLLSQSTGKYNKVDIEEVIKVNNILIGSAETSEYMDRIFIDLYDVCSIGSVYEKTIEQKERLEKYKEMSEEIEEKE
jgi:DNA polymerase III alpha subunit